MYDVKDECYYHINTGQELNLGAILEIGHKYNKFYNEIYNSEHLETNKDANSILLEMVRAKTLSFQNQQVASIVLKTVSDSAMITRELMFEETRKEINKLPLATSYKNDLFKFIKAILNYGSKWYDFNFTPVYNKMTNFTNPNELKKEMLFFTIDEFNQFISVEDDIMFRPLFETLYYMGLRKGELRGLQWKDIDFKNKIMRIYKQIPSIYSMDNYKLSPLKTQNSNRDLPINDLLLADLKRLYNYKKEFKNFSQEWFVFGNDLPLTKDSIRSRKNRNCKLAQVKQIRIHDFRHSCASFLINYGASITLVAKYLGHTKIDETLNTYSHMYQNKLEDIVKLINKNNSILLAKREREKEKNTIDNDYITNEKNDIEICL